MTRHGSAAEFGIMLSAFPETGGMGRNSSEGKESAGAGDLHKTWLNIADVQPLIRSQTVETFCAIPLWE